jgi:hypothetical protein
MTEERVTVSLRLRPAAVVRLDEIAAGREVSRSQVLREAVGAVVNPRADITGYGYRPAGGDPGVAAPATVVMTSQVPSQALSAAEWKQWLWLNDFAEKCYLAGEPVKIGANLEGLRFALTLAEDPDLAIP